MEARLGVTSLCRKLISGVKMYNKLMTCALYLSLFDGSSLNFVEADSVFGFMLSGVFADLIYVIFTIEKYTILCLLACQCPQQFRIVVSHVWS